MLARILLMVLFMVSGWGKLTDFQDTVGYMVSPHAPLPQVAAGVGGLHGVPGRYRPVAGLLFVLFVLGTGVLGHALWSMAEHSMNMPQFLKNLSIAGWLLLLLLTGGGRYAVAGRPC